MKRTTIFADEELMNELKGISKEENKSMAELMREAMENYIKKKHKLPRKLSFVGISSGSRIDISDKHEELIWKKSSK